jgi:hypothetical protein
MYVNLPVDYMYLWTQSLISLGGLILCMYIGVKILDFFYRLLVGWEPDYSQLSINCHLLFS